jgi:hypothetical protein
MCACNARVPGGTRNIAIRCWHCAVRSITAPFIRYLHEINARNPRRKNYLKLPIFTAPSWPTFTSLACGWALAGDRHTITTYMWLTGATTIKHFSRFYVFLGCPLYNKRWQLWGAVIRLAGQFVPAGEVIRGSFDDR